MLLVAVLVVIVAILAVAPRSSRFRNSREREICPLPCPPPFGVEATLGPRLLGSSSKYSVLRSTSSRHAGQQVSSSNNLS